MQTLLRALASRVADLWQHKPALDLLGRDADDNPTWSGEPWPGGMDLVLDYDDRGELRGKEPSDGDAALIRGLGVMVYQQGSTEPDDDETSIRTDDAGAWLLEAVHWDLVWAYTLTALEGRIVGGSVTVGVTSVASAGSVTVTGDLLGARAGDVVVATPPGELGAGRLTYHAYVPATDQVSIVITNPSSASQSLGDAEGEWRVALIREVQ